jgi:hypothetical protein
LKIEIILVVIFSLSLASLVIIPIFLYHSNSFSSSSFSQRAGDEFIWERFAIVLYFESNGTPYYEWQATGGVKITITTTNRTMIYSVLYDTLWGLTAQNTAYNRTWQSISSAVPLLDTYNSTFGCCPRSSCGSWVYFIPHNETAANKFLHDTLSGIFGTYNWTSGPHGYDGLVTLTSGTQRIVIQYNENGVMQSWKYFENGVLQGNTELISNQYPIWEKSIFLSMLLWLGTIAIIVTGAAMIATVYSDHFHAFYNRFRSSRICDSIKEWCSFPRPSLWCFGVGFLFVCYLLLDKYPHELGHAIVANIFGFQSKITINFGAVNAFTSIPMMLYASTTQKICIYSAGCCSSLVFAIIVKFGFGRLKPVRLLCSWIAIGLLLDPLLYPLTNMNTEGVGDWYIIVHWYNGLWIAIAVILAAFILIIYSVYTIVVDELNLKKSRRSLLEIAKIDFMRSPK